LGHGHSGPLVPLSFVGGGTVVLFSSWTRFFPPLLAMQTGALLGALAGKRFPGLSLFFLFNAPRGGAFFSFSPFFFSLFRQTGDFQVVGQRFFWKVRLFFL